MAAQSGELAHVLESATGANVRTRDGRESFQLEMMEKT